MSHITKITTKFRDLNAVETAADVLGTLELRRDQKTFRAWGGSRPACDAALHIKGAAENSFEIGLVADGNGAYDAQCDFWDGSVARAAGPDLARLKQEYSIALSVERANETLARKGFRLAPRQSLANGNVLLRLERR